MNCYILNFNKHVLMIQLMLTVCFLNVDTAKCEHNTEKLVQDATTNFTLRITGKIQDATGGNKNILYSPIILYIVLDLVYLGAAKESREILAKVLYLPANDNCDQQIQTQLGKIMNSIIKKPKNAQYEVSLANAIFVQQEYTLKANYVNQIKDFNAKIENLNFIQNDVATDYINKWVSNNTKGQIPKLFPNAVDKDTKMMLVSTMLFNDTWAKSFQNKNTKTEKFNTGVKNIDVKMMNNYDNILYYVNSQLKFKSIILDFKYKNASTIFILPEPSQSLKQLVDQLTVEDLRQILQQSRLTKVDYKVPKLKLSSSESLKQPLSSAGMADLFKYVDMSNMVDSKLNNLKISEVKQAATIVMDENGVFFTAAVATGISTTSITIIPQSAIKFYLNRPYLLYIYDKDAGAITFLSMVYQPST